MVATYAVYVCLRLFYIKVVYSLVHKDCIHEEGIDWYVMNSAGLTPMDNVDHLTAAVVFSSLSAFDMLQNEIMHIVYMIPDMITGEPQPLKFLQAH